MNAPVSPDHPPFTLSWLSAFHRGVSQLDDSCAVIGVNQILKSRLCSGKGTGLQAIHCLQFGSPSVHACLDIPLKTANVSNLLRQSQPFLAKSECLFAMLALGDVTGDFRKPHYVSALVLYGRNAKRPLRFPSRFCGSNRLIV